MKIFPIWLKVLIVIVELIIHASAIFMIMLIVYCIQTNPDWKITNTRHYNYKINYIVKSNLYNLKDLSNEITTIVRKYQKNPKLVKINYHFEKEHNKYISLYFIKKIIKIQRKHISLMLKLIFTTKKLLRLKKLLVKVQIMMI